MGTPMAAVAVVVLLLCAATALGGPAEAAKGDSGAAPASAFDQSTAGALWRSWQTGQKALASANGVAVAPSGSDAAVPGGASPNCHLSWDPRQGGWVYRCDAPQPQVPYLQPYSGVDTSTSERVDLNWYLGGYYDKAAKDQKK